MAIINSRIVRCKAIINAPFATVGLIDVATNQTIETVRGNATRFQFAFYTANGSIADLSNVSSINLKIQPSQLPEGVALADKTIPASELDLTTTDATWTNGTKQQAQFIFSNAEMNLAMTEVKKNFWLVVTAILTTGEEVTLAGGSIVWHEDNNATAGSPPINPGSPLSTEQGDARYEALPLRRTTPPVNQVIGTGGTVSKLTIQAPTNPVAGSTVTIDYAGGGIAQFEYGFNLSIGSTAEISRQNLAYAINNGDNWVWATVVGNTIELEAKYAGANNNDVNVALAVPGWSAPSTHLTGGSNGVSAVAGTPGIVGQRALVTETVGGNTVTSTWLCVSVVPFTWMREVNVHGGNTLHGPQVMESTLWVKGHMTIGGALTVVEQLDTNNATQTLAYEGSVVNRKLGDARYAPIHPSEFLTLRDSLMRINCVFGDTANLSGGTMNLSAASSIASVNITGSTDAYVARNINFTYALGSINYPEGGWFTVALSAHIYGASTFAFIGSYNPAASGTESRVTPFFGTSVTHEGRWMVQIMQAPGGVDRHLHARVVWKTTSGSYNEGPWVALPNVSHPGYEKPIHFAIRIGSNAESSSRTVRVYAVRGGGRGVPAALNSLSDLVFIGEANGITASYPPVIRVGCCTPVSIAEPYIVFLNPQFQAY